MVRIICSEQITVSMSGTHWPTVMNMWNKLRLTAALDHRSHNEKPPVERWSHFAGLQPTESIGSDPRPIRSVRAVPKQFDYRLECQHDWNKPYREWKQFIVSGLPIICNTSVNFMPAFTLLLCIIFTFPLRILSAYICQFAFDTYNTHATNNKLTLPIMKSIFLIF